MNNNVQNINDIFKYLAQKNGTEEYDTFFSLLKTIKYDSNLLDYYGDEFVENMIKLLPNIKNKYNKASLLETIVQCLYDYSFSENYCKEILNEYVLCLAENATNVEDAVICLNGFIHIGIKQRDIFIKLAENLAKEDAITLLCQMDVTDWGDIPKELTQFLEEVHNAYNIRWRSIIIGQFLLLVNPKCRRYGEISGITLVYKSYKGVYEDCWPKGLLNFKEVLIKSKVLSIKEIEILEKLDKILSNETELGSLEVEMLYNDFFEGRDVFDVIYTFPK
ncbi:hypothetical protein [Clostridium beijerinckii]|uniref:Uncharacterized protein n=1 Tax=Clostridium beijerinckii TaxID=1520 RepID=A0AAX0B7C4_CLOBE|nr:hypothetical protein [Clostridium beijerinckii]NRT91280.1 hypothetical protein [Clostridium beijerinckii]NYC70806.1 hypothetical protein [Clostridium beijerinckii]